MVKKFRKGVFIVVFRKEKNIFGKERIRYLLLKRKLHWVGWEFPKGGIERGEKILDAVEREVMEETGQRAISIKLFKESGRYDYGELFGDRPGVAGQSYRLSSVELKDKNIKFDEREHSDYKWVSFEKALEILTWDNQKKCLRIVDRWLR